MKKLSLLWLLIIALMLSACSGSAATGELPPPVAPPMESEPISDAISSAPAPELPPEAETAPEISEVPLPSPEPAPSPEAPTAPVESPLEPVPAEPMPAPNETPEEAPEADSDGFIRYNKIPILMYHEVNDLLANSLYLSVEDFTSHLTYFEEAGIHPISMQQLYDHWFNEAPLPEKPIVLTFDDGYRSMYTTVYPLLKERGWSGTFYCITSTFENPGHLTADMIAEMAAGGMEIGSHTVSHLELNSLGSERLNRELAESRSILAALTGQEVNMLCYPAGRYNDATKDAANDTGYLSGVTTQYGFATKSQGMFDLKRIRVSTDCGAGWMKNVLDPLGY